MKKDAFLISEKRPFAEDRIHMMNLFNWEPGKHGDGSAASY
jgi:hypothetical protein